MGSGKFHADHGCAGCSYKPCKALLGVALVICLLLLVLGNVEELEDGHVMTSSASAMAARRSMVAENIKLQVFVEVEENKPNSKDDSDHTTQYRATSPAAHSKDIVDINYMSKRRVPNGADPIHNRRAGKSRRPPSMT